MIRKLADDETRFNLALSLHAANEEKRSKIMPINESNSLTALKKALQYYTGKTGQMVTLEYIIFDKFNICRSVKVDCGALKKRAA